MTTLFAPIGPSATPRSLSIGFPTTFAVSTFEDTYASVFGSAKPGALVDSVLWSAVAADPDILDIASPTSATTLVTGTFAGLCKLRCTVTDELGNEHVFEKPIEVLDVESFAFSVQPGVGTNGHAVGFYPRDGDYPAAVEFRPTAPSASFTITATPRDRHGHGNANFSAPTDVGWVVVSGTAVLFDDSGPAPSIAGTLAPTLLVQGIGASVLALTARNSLGAAIESEVTVLVLGPTSCEVR